MIPQGKFISMSAEELLEKATTHDVAPNPEAIVQSLVAGGAFEVV